jgi:hypothetical protein
MNPQKTSGIFSLIFTALFLLVVPSTILAQAAGAQPPGSAQTSPKPATVTSETSVINQTLTGTSELRPVYGLQGVLVETLGGKLLHRNLPMSLSILPQP